MRKFLDRWRVAGELVNAERAAIERQENLLTALRIVLDFGEEEAQCINPECQSQRLELDSWERAEGVEIVQVYLACPRCEASNIFQMDTVSFVALHCFLTWDHLEAYNALDEATQLSEQAAADAAGLDDLRRLDED